MITSFSNKPQISEKTSCLQRLLRAKKTKSYYFNAYVV